VRNRVKKTIRLFLLTGLSTLCGCISVKPMAFKMPVEPPESFSSDGTELLPDRWWESLNDPNLNAIVEAGLRDNFTIRSAWDRLAQAEQIAHIAGVPLWPQADYAAQATRSRTEIQNSVRYTSSYSAGAVISYEVDLWGRIRSSQQAAALDAEAAAEDVQAAAITLSSILAKTWYQLAEAQQQARVIEQQLATNQKVLTVISMQFAQGQAGASDVLRQKQLVESSRGQAIQNQETLALLQHQLSVLTGKTPGLWWADTPIELIEPPVPPALGVPSTVLQRRPDVRSAYKVVQAADLRVAAAIADQYPTVSVFADAQTSADRVDELFDDWLGSLTANIAGPLFDAGLRKAEVKRTQAVVSQLLNDYGRTVLTALQETEDALAQEDYQHQYVQSLQTQLLLARQAYERTRENYLKGQLDYLRVLESLVSQQSLEQQELASRRILLERRIDLCRSIAGSWPMERPEQAVLIEE
jgi:NodT family efflux transporter outer membrane factor (OMF) lipoprotein